MLWLWQRDVCEVLIGEAQDLASSWRVVDVIIYSIKFWINRFLRGILAVVREWRVLISQASTSSMSTAVYTAGEMLLALC